MTNCYDEPNGYLESIRKGSAGLNRLRGGIYYGSGDRDGEIARLRKELEAADAIVIGAGAGLSTSAGFTYAGDRFNEWFADFSAKYGFEDMYSGGFYPFPFREEQWAFWARNIYINRYMDAPKPVYSELLQLMKEQIKKDRQRVTIHGYTHLGLMEISRKREDLPLSTILPH